MVLAKLWDARSRPLYPLPNVGFNATDDLVVTDGALWDPMEGVRCHFGGVGLVSDCLIVVHLLIIIHKMDPGLFMFHNIRLP